MTLEVKNEIHLFIVKTNFDFSYTSTQFLVTLEISMHTHFIFNWNEISIFILIPNGTRKCLIIHVKKLKIVAKHTLLSYGLCDTLCTQKPRQCPGADWNFILSVVHKGIFNSVTITFSGWTEDSEKKVENFILF